MSVEKITYEKEQYLGYTFHICSSFEFAFDNKKNILLIYSREHDYLSGVVHFLTTEDNRVKLFFKPRSSFNLTILDKDVHIDNADLVPY